MADTVGTVLACWYVTLSVRWNEVRLPVGLSVFRGVRLLLHGDGLVFLFHVVLHSELSSSTCVLSGERPFRCDMCSKTFNQKGALLVHMTKHTGERSHTCEFCPATFAQRGNLRAHIHVRLLRYPPSRFSLPSFSAQCFAVSRTISVPIRAMMCTGVTSGHMDVGRWPGVCVLYGEVLVTVV